MKIPSILRAFTLLAAVVLLAGCGGAKQKYYRLSSDGPAPVGTAGLSVGIGPVTLPGYIDRAELVFQSTANEYQVPLDAHWTGTLKDNVSAVLAANVGARLRSGNVVAFPWNNALRLRYTVAVDVTRFNAVSGTGAVLEVSWRVLNAEGSLVSRHNASYEERVVGDGYDPVVTAESKLLARLSDDIAASLRRR